jgi:hypothetical protein
MKPATQPGSFAMKPPSVSMSGGEMTGTIRSGFSQGPRPNALRTSGESPSAFTTWNGVPETSTRTLANGMQAQFRTPSPDAAFRRAFTENPGVFTSNPAAQPNLRNKLSQMLSTTNLASRRGMDFYKAAQGSLGEDQNLLSNRLRTAFNL